MNVLITSISKKVPLIKAVKISLAKINEKAIVVGADSDPKCIGQYFVDKFWISPEWSKITPNEFLSYCQSEAIDKVIPTRDGELLFFAKNREFFKKNGVVVMISESDSVEAALDKLKFYQKCEELNFPAVTTTTSIDDIESETYVVKERLGAGSQNIGIALSKNEAINFAKKLKAPIFQPYIKGPEISADLYVDKKRKTKGVILRKRLMVVSGESQVTETFRDEKLENMLADLAEKFNFFGHIMFQIIAGDQIHILECNPRFGGASTLSIKAGLDSYYWFFLEASNKNLEKIPFKRNEKNIRLVRYPKDLIF